MGDRRLAISGDGAQGVTLLNHPGPVGDISPLAVRGISPLHEACVALKQRHSGPIRITHQHFSLELEHHGV